MSIITIQPSTGRVYVDGVPITLTAYGLGRDCEPGVPGNIADIAKSHHMPCVPPSAAGRFFRVWCFEAWNRFRNEAFRP